MNKTRLSILFVTVLLLAAVGLVIYGQTRPLQRTFHGQLAEMLPPAPSGWTRTARSIADTPEMRQKVDELLNYDDGVFYDYTKGNLRLSVYIAYWAPGRMSSRLVAGHTPDVCWVSAGWQCTKRGEVSPTLTAHNSKPSAFSSRLYPAESRTFIANDTTEYVWFWHIVDEQPQSYRTGRKPPWYASLADLLERGLNQRSEQFFIRLSSAQPLDDPNLQTALAVVLEALPIRQHVNSMPHFHSRDMRRH